MPCGPTDQPLRTEREQRIAGRRPSFSLRRIAVSVLLAVLLLAVALSYRSAIQAPVVRRIVIHVLDYPVGIAPVRILLLSDLHVHGPDMPPSRVHRIVAQVNSLDPDVVVVAGDFVGDNWVGTHYSIEQAIAPLARLRARRGVYAVLGNNDYDAGAGSVRRALEQAGVRVLVNEAVQAGPVALGGIDGNIHVRQHEWIDRREKTYSALERTPGIKVLVVHRPDEFAWTPTSVQLVLAGHTHCGQIVLPFLGALETGSDFGQRFVCGVVRGGPKVMIVSAGVGTSHVPLRIGAPPDMWLVSITGMPTKINGDTGAEVRKQAL